MDDKAVVCVHCGCAVDKKPDLPDAPSMGFALLGFFLPLVGLILYLVYEGRQPLKAKSAGKGALIGIIVGFILAVIAVVLFTVMTGYLISGFWC